MIKLNYAVSTGSRIDILLVLKCLVMLLKLVGHGSLLGRSSIREVSAVVYA